MSLVQIQKHEGSIARVPNGETPLIELHLEDNQHVTGIKLEKRWQYNTERKTDDWDWTLYVVTTL